MNRNSGSERYSSTGNSVTRVLQSRSELDRPQVERGTGTISQSLDELVHKEIPNCSHEESPILTEKQNASQSVICDVLINSSGQKIQPSLRLKLRSYPLQIIITTYFVAGFYQFIKIWSRKYTHKGNEFIIPPNSVTTERTVITISEISLSSRTIRIFTRSFPQALGTFFGFMILIMATATLMF